MRGEKLPDGLEGLLSHANVMTAATDRPQLDAARGAARVALDARFGAGQPRIEIAIGYGLGCSGARKPFAPIAKALLCTGKGRKLRGIEHAASAVANDFIGITMHLQKRERVRCRA